MLRDAADGMSYLHEATPSFIHRDLKSAVCIAVPLHMDNIAMSLLR